MGCSGVTVATLVPTYLRLIPKYKVLVYNGDIDPYVRRTLPTHTYTHTHTHRNAKKGIIYEDRLGANARPHRKRGLVSLNPL